MYLTNKYNGTITEIQATLNEQKPQVWEFGDLIRDALINNNENLLTALLEYKNTNPDTIDLQTHKFMSHFSLEEIKQYTSKLGLFLFPNKTLEESTVQSLYLSLILKYDTRNYDYRTEQWISNPEKKKLKAQYLKEAFEESSKLANTLTIYHDTGHAFVKLECTKCSNGMPAILSAGLYPPQESDASEMCAFQEHQDEPTSPHLDNELLGLMGLPFMKSSLRSGSNYYGKPYSSYAKIPKTGAKSIGVTYNINKDDAHANDKYILTIEHNSFVANSLHHIESVWSYENIDNVFHKSFNISSEAATKVLDRIAFLANHCDRNYKYESLGSNCIDFVQHIYATAGLPGDHFKEVYPDNYPLNILGAYKTFTDLKNWAGELYNNFWE